MSFFNKIKSAFARSPTIVRTELITERGNGFYSWGGNIYQSDIVRSCIGPFVRAAGKLKLKQVRDTKDGIIVSPDLYLKILLAEPNPFMTGQTLQEKLATQYELNNNAFAYINRDDNGYATEIYPLAPVAAQAIYDKNFNLYIKFTLRNGKTVTYPYEDIIHLRQHFNEDDIFGTANTEALTANMEVMTMIDQGIVKAITNGSVIKWLMKFKTSMRPEDIKSNVTKFIDAFMKLDTDDDTLPVGVAGVDATKADMEQVTPTDYVPNASQMDKTKQRIYDYFGTNDDIVQSKFNEDKWNAYFEAKIEPFARKLSEEMSRKIFSRRERGFGNRIVAEANSLQYASMSTKLNLLQMVDRGALTPNEWREVLNLGAIEGGDKAVRRLDTALVGGDNK